jgi:hypothetical protein
MLLVILFIYFLPTIIALARGHLSALAIFFLNLFLGWTMICWLIALIWSCTGNTVANLRRFEASAHGPPQWTAPPRSQSSSLWLVLILIILAVVVLDERRDFRDIRSFDLPFSHETFRL